ncbi:hypothetical protein VTL71DRAFT_15762 [Oculimacula yallundae]|uniref:Uncharacterized protein n=1 Tax=Oculimacula yallundae TaxID=86028 RepID=A0ABR4CEI3_9HELO
MFDLPDAKRIRRSDLNRSRSSSPSSDISQTEANATLLQAKLAAIYGPIEYDVPLASTEAKRDGWEDVHARERVAGKKESQRKQERDGDTDSNSTSENEEETTTSLLARNPSPTPSEHEYEFSLFRPSHTSTAINQPHSQTIILSSSPGPREGRILSSRPLSHFIAKKADGKRKAELQYAAVSGEQVLQGRERRAWGLEVQWRVRVLRDGVLSVNVKPGQSAEGDQWPSSGSTTTALRDIEVGGKSKPHKPNKKRRIFLRTQARKREIAEEARKKARAGKEEAEKEKRTRLNRAKKVKRRLKEKAKKAEGGGGNVGTIVGKEEEEGGVERNGGRGNVDMN